jgi:ATP-binding cassette subfamily G (WHITE) protein 1
MRYCLENLVIILYANNRSDIFCPDEEIYCHYSNSKTILRDLGIQVESFNLNIVAILGQLFLFKTLSYFTLKRRLNSG